MALKNQIPWSRLLVESGIIISILMAFGIDAWWASRAERAREHAALAGIERDFQAHSEIIRLNIERQEARIEATERLLAAIGPSGGGTDYNPLGDLGLAGLAGPVLFQGGSLETLVGTVGLAGLQNADLRLALTRWMQAAEDLESLNDFVPGEAGLPLDFLRTRQSLQDLDRSVGATDLPPSGFDSNLDQLLLDLEFANVVDQQHYASTVLLASLGNLADIADEISSEIPAR
jgi:hypothetical protein